MPAFAPRAAVQGEMVRGAAARQAHYPGTIIIAGISYACMLHLGPVEPSIDSGTGTAYLAQRGEACVLKPLLAAAPKRDAVIKAQVEGHWIDFIVESCSASLHALEWVIKFYRLPPKP